MIIRQRWHVPTIDMMINILLSQSGHTTELAASCKVNECNEEGVIVVVVQ